MPNINSWEDYIIPKERKDVKSRNFSKYSIKFKDKNPEKYIVDILTSVTVIKSFEVSLNPYERKLAIFNFRTQLYEYVNTHNFGAVYWKIVEQTDNLFSIKNENHTIGVIERTLNSYVRKEEIDSGSLIVTRNKAYSVKIFRTINIDPNKNFYTYSYPFDYQKSRCPIFRKYLKDITCNDKELEYVIQEMVGYTFDRDCNSQKIFVCVGSGSNGKSVLAKVISALHGSRCSASPLSDFEKPFGMENLIEKNVNITAEEYFCITSLSAVVKNIVSNDLVDVSKKYKTNESTKLYCKLITMTNELPQIKIKREDIRRRLMCIPFNATFDEATRDVHLYEKIKNELSGIFIWAMEGLRRLRNNEYKFTNSKAVSVTTERCYSNGYNLSLFIEKWLETNNHTVPKIKIGDLYTVYTDYCKKHSYRYINKRDFFDGIKDYADKHPNAKITSTSGYDYFAYSEQ